MVVEGLGKRVKEMVLFVENAQCAYFMHLCFMLLHAWYL